MHLLGWLYNLSHKSHSNPKHNRRLINSIKRSQRPCVGFSIDQLERKVVLSAPVGVPDQIVSSVPGFIQFSGSQLVANDQVSGTTWVVSVSNPTAGSLWFNPATDTVTFQPPSDQASGVAQAYYTAATQNGSGSPDLGTPTPVTISWSYASSSGSGMGSAGGNGSGSGIGSGMSVGGGSTSGSQSTFWLPAPVSPTTTAPDPNTPVESSTG